MTYSARILIADDDIDILTILAMKLGNLGYDVIQAKNGLEAMEKAQSEKPDLILLDIMMPYMDGLSVCEKLREHTSTRLVPIILVTARNQTSDKVSGFKSGADDYITKPFDDEELEARVGSILRKSKRDLSASPLTGIPGSTSIEKELLSRIEKGERFVVGYLDIDHFKVYNDGYGYEKGDTIIKLTAQIIERSIREFGNKNDFIGHIGGDDFIFITGAENIDAVCRNIIASFDGALMQAYSEDDLKRGYVVGIDRKGVEQQFPLLAVSIAVVSNEYVNFTHPGEIAKTAAELKKLAKSQKGSIYVKDRRKGK